MNSKPVQLPRTPLLSLWVIAGLSLSAVVGAEEPAASTVVPNAAMAEAGIRFACEPGRLHAIESGMDAYLSSMGIKAGLVVKKVDRARGVLVYTLNTPEDDFNTLDLKNRSALHIHDEVVTLPGKYGRSRRVVTVSKKEILLSLLQHGRLTGFNDAACEVEALKDHVALRQNIVAWTEILTWGWPDGGDAKWNRKYWTYGTPRQGVPIHEAFDDAFMNQRKYAIGCYTATKLVVAQGVLDYYRRGKKDPVRRKLVEDRLSADKDPLVGVEPEKMWDFEKDFNPQDWNIPGKLLKIQYGIAPMNFVPGDWIYMLNTDPITYKKVGYEGSNAIYLGRGKFDDYYNDNRHSYTYLQKLDDVYQWRNGVFNRRRDIKRVEPLGRLDYEHLGRPPADGGLVESFRVFPYLFGYEELPVRKSP